MVKNRTRVLDRINLTIREGEHTAILGPNGAGKSYPSSGSSPTWITPWPIRTARRRC